MGVNDKQEFRPGRGAQRNQTFLVVTMFFIEDGERIRVKKDGIASSNEMLCLARFILALRGSQSNTKRWGDTPHSHSMVNRLEFAL
jgi:hypothetical protein